MFSISFADGLLLLEVEPNHSFICLFYGFLLLDALQVLLLVLRDLLCVDIDAVSLGGRGRVWAPRSRRWRPRGRIIDATIHTNQRPQDAGAAPSKSSVSFCVRW